MKATYQNNLKKIETLLDKKKGASLDIFGFPFDKLVLPHGHTSHSLGPWDEHYYSPLNHVNLFQVVDSKQLARLHFALVRDGLFTLVDFFHRFSTPKGFKIILIVHEKFKEFIPLRWSNSVLFFDFDITSSLYESKTYNDQLIIKGSLMEGAFCNDQFIKNIDEVKKQKKIKKLLLCLSPRQNYFLRPTWQGDVEFSNISNTFMKSVYLELSTKLNLEFINWKSLFSMSDLHRYEFLDANKKDNLYIDDYTDFYLLKKGAKPVFIEAGSRKNENDIIVPLSHVHGIRVLANPHLSKINHWGYLTKTFELLEIEKGDQLNVSAFQAIQKLSQA